MSMRPVVPSVLCVHVPWLTLPSQRAHACGDTMAKAATTAETSTAEEHPLFDYIRRNELGADLRLETPFGGRAVLYADYTASGRALSFIEDYVRNDVLPTYGNTHTSTTKTGRQSSDLKVRMRRASGSMPSGTPNSPRSTGWS